MKNKWNCVCKKCGNIINEDELNRHLYGEHEMDCLSPDDVRDEFEYYNNVSTRKFNTIVKQNSQGKKESK